MPRLLFLFLILSFVSKAQIPFSKDYTLNEAATSTKVNAIIQDEIGYIWLGTEAGLYNFNGQEFTKIKDSVNKPVTAVSASHRSVYVGYADGKVGEVINASIKIIHIMNAVPSSAITSIHIVKPGLLFVCTEEQGIFIVINNIGINIDAGKGLPDNYVYKLTALSDSRILLGSDKGLGDIEWKDKKANVHIYTTRQGLPDNIVRVIRAIPKTTWYWLGTQDGGIALFDKDSRKIWVPSLDSNWKWGQVNDIVSVSKAHTWVITENGYLVDINLKDSMQAVAKPYYYPARKLQKMLIDRSGNIWSGTDQGLTMITAEYLNYIQPGPPYALRKVTAIACDRNNILWFTQNNDLYKLSLNAPAKLPELAYRAEAAIYCLYVDRSNRLWIGTSGKGLWYKGSNGNFIKATGQEVLKNESILNITGTASSLWVAGLDGVEELSYPTESDATIRPIKHHNKGSGIGTDYVFQLFPDSKGSIWMATDGAGITKYDGNSYQHWDYFIKHKIKEAYTVTEDTKGDIWVGTFSKDLYRFHNNSWEDMRAYENPGNVDINISSVIANHTGQVISVFQRCMDLWYPESHAFRHFNRRLGLGIDSTSNVLNCVAKDTSGNVYVPSEPGIIVFNNEDKVYDIRPSVDITTTSLYQKSDSAQRHRFAYDENDISFHFKGVNFVSPERLNYRYMLSGYKERWINTSDESVTFPQLPPGIYTFKVQASLNNDFRNAKEDTYAFVIGSPFWRKPWFIILVIVALVFLVNAYVKVREKRLKNMSRLQEERMVFEYEHLKSQVNPHFLFNSLNTLTSLIEENKETALEYTVNLSDLYRNMLAYRHEDLILLSEEWDILQNYLFVQKSRFGAALRLAADVPEDIMNSKKIIPMALQLLVENAIKHNIVSNSQPLIISIRADENEITVRNSIQPKISKEKSAGIGLINIRNRYKLLTNKRIKFGLVGNEFIVTLPLL